MNDFRYKLESYKGRRTRYICPSCGKRNRYTRYVDSVTGSHLPFEYGKCERLDNCTYHLNPYKDGYSKRKWLEEKDKGSLGVSITIKPIPPKPTPEIYIPFEIFKKSLSPKGYEQNRFIQYLDNLFGSEITQQLINTFFIGNSNYWTGSTVFWLINKKNKVTGGQVILYDKNGNTYKEKLKDGSIKRHNSWVHTALKSGYQRKGLTTPTWLKKYSNMSGNKFSCLFGLPQLNQVSKTKPIAIVEAAKTAIIATAYLPQYVWLAVGGKSYINAHRLWAVRGRKITLFPDNGAYESWNKKAKELSHLGNINVSDLLERKGQAGTDLADYLVQFKLEDFGS